MDITKAYILYNFFTKHTKTNGVYLIIIIIFKVLFFCSIVYSQYTIIFIFLLCPIHTGKKR